MNWREAIAVLGIFTVQDISNDLYHHHHMWVGISIGCVSWALMYWFVDGLKKRAQASAPPTEEQIVSENPWVRIAGGGRP
jgi:protein-S-isoprenylcysteine O-methyltransferase Ste14